MIATLRRLRLVPVIVIENSGAAPALGRALVEGGLPCAEITFRTPAAREALARLTGEVPEVLAGAGTVLTPEQAASARAAGAKFVVAPGFNPAVVDYCLEHDIPVYPGVATPSEIEAALARGLSLLKFFPAEALGGVAYLKAISAPYGGVEFMPTGGVNLENVSTYLAFSRVVACGGSWMAPQEWLAAGNFDGITAEVKKAVRATQPAGGATHK